MKTNLPKLLGPVLVGALMSVSSAAAAEDAGDDKADVPAATRPVHVRVRDRAERKGVVLVGKETGWSRACDLPCEVDLPRGTALRIRIDEEHADALVDGDPSVPQDVVVAPDGRRRTGSILMVGGGTFLGTAFIMVLTGVFTQVGNPDSGNGMLTAAAVFGGTGAALMISGAICSGGRSNVQLAAPIEPRAAERRPGADVASLLPSATVPLTMRFTF